MSVFVLGLGTQGGREGGREWRLGAGGRWQERKREGCKPTDLAPRPGGARTEGSSMRGASPTGMPRDKPPPPQVSPWHLLNALSVRQTPMI